jgi:hypothetical protein
MSEVGDYQEADKEVESWPPDDNILMDGYDPLAFLPYDLTNDPDFKGMDFSANPVRASEMSSSLFGNLPPDFLMRAMDVYEQFDPESFDAPDYTSEQLEAGSAAYNDLFETALADHQGLVDNRTRVLPDGSSEERQKLLMLLESPGGEVAITFERITSRPPSVSGATETETSSVSGTAEAPVAPKMPAGAVLTKQAGASATEIAEAPVTSETSEAIVVPMTAAVPTVAGGLETQLTAEAPAVSQPLPPGEPRQTLTVQVRPNEGIEGTFTFDQRVVDGQTVLFRRDQWGAFDDVDEPSEVRVGDLQMAYITERVAMARGVGPSATEMYAAGRIDAQGLALYSDDLEAGLAGLKGEPVLAFKLDDLPLEMQAEALQAGEQFEADMLAVLQARRTELGLAPDAEFVTQHKADDSGLLIHTRLNQGADGSPYVQIMYSSLIDTTDPGEIARMSQLGMPPGPVVQMDCLMYMRGERGELSVRFARVLAAHSADITLPEIRQSGVGLLSSASFVRRYLNGLAYEEPEVKPWEEQQEDD